MQNLIPRKSEKIVSPEVAAGLVELIKDDNEEEPEANNSEEDTEDANKLYKEINKKIGKDENGLYYGHYDGTVSKEYRVHKSPGSIKTLENSLMAILCCLIGKKDEAQKIHRRINSYIGKFCGLYNQYQPDGDRRSAYQEKELSDNAAMAISYCLLDMKDEAEDLYKNIVKSFRKENKLYELTSRIQNTKEEWPLCITIKDNSLMAVLCCMLGKEDEARGILHDIEGKGFEKEGGLYKAYSCSETLENSALGWLYAVLGKKSKAESLYNGIKAYKNKYKNNMKVHLNTDDCLFSIFSVYLHDKPKKEETKAKKVYIGGGGWSPI